MSEADILRGYAADAAELIPRFEALSTLDVLAPVADLLPSRPCRVLDVGAGTGRDAAWLAEQGHRAVAVEPVEELRRAGIALHPASRISWVDDRLPGLENVRSRSDKFDLILGVGVWQHVAPEDQPGAFAALSALAARRARLILSVRHGPGAQTRPCFPADPDRMVEWAEDEGMRLLKRSEADSIQQENRDRGVTWTWLCFERP